MRNIFLICCIALLAASCTNKNYVIEGIAPEFLNDQWVYLVDVDSNDNIDSTKIGEGKFSFTGPADPTALLGLVVDRQYMVNLIPEAGKIKADFTDRSVSGTPLNDKLTELHNELTVLNHSGNEGFQKLRDEFANDPELFQEKLNEYTDDYTKQLGAIYEKYFATNNNNALGKYIFLIWQDASDEKKEEMIAQMDEKLKQSPIIKNAIEDIQNLKATAEGQMFKDFNLPFGNIDGSSVSLSDYVGKGKYTLVDFWASWCGPCIREFPVLKEIYKKHKGDKFEIVGVAVWDERDAILNGIDQHGISWPVIMDEQENMDNTNLYGIKAIPQIILFGPDGTIIARNLRGDALKEKIAEILL